MPPRPRRARRNGGGIEDLVEEMKVTRTILALAIITFGSVLFAQTSAEPELVDGFGKASNDELLARIDNFQDQLRGRDSVGFVVLSGSSLSMYLNKRRIEGCNIMRHYPADSFKFVFSEDPVNVVVELWKVPRATESTKFTPTIPDYKLTDLNEPIELSVSMATDDFCPRHFDLEWYSHFMAANPSFRGKVVIDSSAREFIRRANKYRNKLETLGVLPSRVRFIRRNFPHERDEQWWLIPPAKK